MDIRGPSFVRASTFATINETLKLFYSFHLKQDHFFDKFTQQLKKHKEALQNQIFDLDAKVNGGLIKFHGRMKP